MKKLLFYLTIICLFNINYTPLFAQGKQLLYNFSLDTILSSSISSQYAEDSFFIVGGQTQNDTITTELSFLATFDYSLHLIKKKYLYFPGLYNRLGGTSVLTKMSTDKYVLAGMEEDFHTNPRIPVEQPYFFIFNKDLDSLGFKKYVDTSRTRIPASMIIDKQKNIIITGSSSSSSIYYDPGLHEWFGDSIFVWVTKYDSNANMIWEHTYLPYVSGSGSEPESEKIILTNDSLGYLIAGNAEDSTHGNQPNDFIMKLDTSGKPQWIKFLKRPYACNADLDIINLKEGGYGFAADYSDTLPYIDVLGGVDPVVSYYYYGKLNEDGDTLWTGFYKTPPNLYYQSQQVAEGDNGDLIVLGYCDSFWKGPSVLWVDSNKHIKSFREYFYNHIPHMYDQQLASISFTKSKQLLLCGVYGSYTPIPGIFDTTGFLSWMVLTDTFGCLDSGCQAGDTVWQHYEQVPIAGSVPIQVNIFPNPARQSLYITTGNTNNKALQAYFCDISGRVLQTKDLQSNSTQLINVEQFPSGLYLLQLWQDGQKIKTYKISHY